MCGQHLAHHRFRSPLHPGTSEAIDDDEADLAALGLLVDLHQLQIALRPQGRADHRQAGTLAQHTHPRDELGRHQAEPRRQVGGHDHAAADRLAVQPFAVAQARLDRVAEGVAEVQNSAQAALALVAADHLRLDLAGALHRLRQRRLVARAQPLDAGLDPGEELGIGDRAVLDDLGQSRRELALGQRVERVEVADHTHRLVERADHVLAQRVVDRGLAADRRVDLRQQRRGHLHEGHAAHVAGRGEAGHVADHAAAQREQHRPAVAGGAQQRVVDALERRGVLEGFAVGQLDRQHPCVVRRQRRLQPGGVQRPDGGVGDDHRGLRLRQAGPGGGIVQQAGADQDVVAAIAQLDADGRADRGGGGRSGGGRRHHGGRMIVVGGRVSGGNGKESCRAAAARRRARRRPAPAASGSC